MDTDETLLGALRLEHGRSAVRFERTYQTTVEDLWEALTDPARVGRWMAPLSGELREGGAWRLDFGDDESRGTVLLCQPPRLLEVSWDSPGEPTSRVTVTIGAAEGTPARASSLLVLEHVLLPVEQAVGYGAGWHAHLAGLEAEVLDRHRHDWDRAFTSALPRYRSLFARLTER